MTAENIKEKTNQKLSDIIDHIKLIEDNNSRRRILH